MALRFRPLGLVSLPMIPWQNRPTQQQVVEAITAGVPTKVSGIPSTAGGSA